MRSVTARCSLAEAVLLLSQHKIYDYATWQLFRKRSTHTAAEAHALKVLPANPATHYDVSWADIAAPKIIDGVATVIPIARPNRLRHTAFLSPAAAIKLMKQLDVSFSTYRYDYKPWLAAQSVEIRKMLPACPRRYYAAPEYAFDPLTYFQRLYSFDKAKAILAAEGINSHRRYRYCVKGNSQGIKFEVSKRFQEYDRHRLPVDYRYYTGDDPEMYRALFGRYQYIRRA
jgi:hypothetical protein